MADLSKLLGVQRGAEPVSGSSHEVAADDGAWATSLRIGETYRPEKPSTWDDASSLRAPRVSLAVSTDLKQWNYRYMFEKKGERSLELDNRLDDMGEVIRQSFGIPGELEDVSIPSQESIYSVGRICARVTPEVTAGPDHGSKRLTQPELMLESSRMLGNGQRVPLALDPACTVRYAWADEATQAASVVGLFPGMIVGVKGRNGSGNKFVAEQLLLPPALPHPATSRAELAQHQHTETKLDGNPLRILAASGPYTHSTDLAYAPWHAFMTHVERVQPDVVVLLGPFVSATHPAVVAGELDELPTALFRRHIGQRLTRLLERAPGTIAILVPSTDDLVHPHHAYPQPFFDKSNAALGLPKRVRCLPNPSVFYVNELAIGVSTADVLGDLRREELVQRVQPGAKAASSEDTGTNSADARDPMMRLARHVLGQRSFYPIYPPSSASKLPLDLSHSRLCALDQVTPDLLLLPSARVKPFVRVVDSTMVVNCGCLALPSEPAKDSARAHPTAFIHMQVDAMPRDALYQGTHAADDELITHSLHSRARIDVIHTE